MEEAEIVCDRLGIFVNGGFQCIANPKEVNYPIRKRVNFLSPHADAPPIFAIQLFIKIHALPL